MRRELMYLCHFILTLLQKKKKKNHNYFEHSNVNNAYNFQADLAGHFNAPFLVLCKD